MQHRPWWPSGEAPLGQQGHVATQGDLAAGLAGLSLHNQAGNIIAGSSSAAAAPGGLSWTDTDLQVDLASSAQTPAGGVGSIFPNSTAGAASPSPIRPTLLYPKPNPASSTQYPVHHIPDPHLYPAVEHKPPAPTAQPPQQQELQEPTCCVGVYLTEPSRELLSCLMPPVHPQAASHHCAILQHNARLADVMCMPLGAQVDVQLTGISADSQVQVVSVTCPQWCPPATSPVPYVLLSHAGTTPDYQHAELVIAEGVTGVSSSYHPLSEPLPLVGMLGAQLCHTHAAGGSGGGGFAHGASSLPPGPVYYSVDQLASTVTEMMLPLLLSQHAPPEQQQWGMHEQQPAMVQPQQQPVGYEQPQQLSNLPDQLSNLPDQLSNQPHTNTTCTQTQEPYGSHVHHSSDDGIHTAGTDMNLPYSTSTAYMAGQGFPAVTTTAPEPPQATPARAAVQVPSSGSGVGQPDSGLVPGLMCKPVVPSHYEVAYAGKSPLRPQQQSHATTPSAMAMSESEATSVTYHSIEDEKCEDEGDMDEFELWMRQDERLADSILPPPGSDTPDNPSDLLPGQPAYNDQLAPSSSTAAAGPGGALLVPVSVALSAAAAGGRDGAAQGYATQGIGAAGAAGIGSGPTPSEAAARGVGVGGSVVARSPARGSGGKLGGATMAVRLTDVGVGDLVEVVPLLHMQHHDQQQHALDLVQGVVQEIVLDDYIQPQGVLVRLDNDNTMGYTAKVILRGYQQTQQAWPELATAPTGPTASNRQKLTSKALLNVNQGGNVEGSGGRMVSVGSGSDVSSVGKGSVGGAAGGGGGGGGGGNKRKSGQGAAPTGGIKVLHVSTSSLNSLPRGVSRAETAAKQPPGVNSNSAAGWPGGGGGGYSSNVPLDEEQVLAMWKEFHKRFGDAICEAVLSDCEGGLAEAVQVLQDQEELPDRLGGIVERSIARVEEEACAAAAVIQQEQEEAAALSRNARGGGWGQRPARPGAAQLTYVRATDKRSGPAPPDSAFPATLGSPAAALGTPGGSWGEGSGKLQVKLLRNSNSLASHATAAGLNTKDLEAMAQLFPGFTPPQLVAILQLASGDVTAAVDELLTLGLATGPDGATDKAAYEYVSTMLGLDTCTSSAAPAADPFPPPATPPVASPGPPGSVWTEGVRGADVVATAAGEEGWQTKVEQLMFNFEGLDRDVAEFSLRSCSGDMGAAIRMIHDSWAASADAQAAADANSLVLAQQLALKQEEGGQKLGQKRQKLPAAGRASGDGGKAVGTPSGRPGSSSGSQWQVVGPGGARGASGAGRPARTAAESWKAKHKVSADKARHIAHIYFGARNVFFQQAAAAYAAGNGKAAAEYAAKGKEYGELAKKYRTASNDEAYKASNWGVRNQFTMDLHGLHVEEALSVLSQQVDALSRLVTPEGVMLKVITGRGNHSINNVAAIKPAVMDWLKSNRLRHSLEPGNDGVVLVHVKSATPH